MKKIVYLAHVLLSILFGVNLEDFDSDLALVEFLYSSHAAIEMKEVTKYRAINNYSQAIKMQKIEKGLEQYRKKPLEVFSKQLLSISGIAIPSESINLSNMSQGQWLYIEWLLENDRSQLVSQVSSIPNTDIFLDPFLVEESSFGNIDYHLSTQFKLVKLAIETRAKKKLKNLEDLEERFIWSAILNTEENLNALLNSIFEINLTISDYYAGSKKACDLGDYTTKSSTFYDIPELEDTWDECECMEEYASMLMKLNLAKIFINEKAMPLVQVEDIACLEKYFDEFLGIINMPTYKYDEIDHEMFCLYFSNNFNNREKQAAFVSEYFRTQGADMQHQFSFILAALFNELLSYSSE